MAHNGTGIPRANTCRRGVDSSDRLAALCARSAFAAWRGVMQTRGDETTEQNSNELPSVECKLPPAEVMERARQLSRRGKLPGFAQTSATGFRADAFATPFEYTLTCTIEAAGDGSRLRFRATMNRRMPWVYALVLLATVWPGVWVTDSMLRTYFSWYTIETWWWYLPITVLPLPWMWSSFLRKSRAGADSSARELIAVIASGVGGVAGA